MTRWEAPRFHDRLQTQLWLLAKENSYEDQGDGGIRRVRTATTLMDTPL
jgi:hypothetical protein